MDLHDALLQLGLLIVVAKLLEVIFRRFGINAIIGYATAGILLGPVTGLVEPDNGLDIILSLGIFIFFFIIGLDELDIRGFVASIRRRLFLASSLSVLIALLVSLTVTSDFIFDLGLGLDWTEALALAGVLSLSSLGLVAKVLVDEGRLREPAGVQMFTAVVIAEIIALFVVGFAISEHFAVIQAGGERGWVTVLTIVGEIVGFVVLTWLFSTFALPRLISALHNVVPVPHLPFGLLLGGLFLVVVAAENVGLHGSLGALLFGAALSFLPYQIRRDVMPGMRASAEGFFVPLFFASAGLYLTLDFLNLPLATILVLILVPFLGKLAGAYLAVRVTKLEAPAAIAVGLMAKGVAETALLLVLFDSGAISAEIFSLLVLLMLGYMILSPIAISLTLGRLKRTDVFADVDREVPSLYRFAIEHVQVGDIANRSRSYADQSISLADFAEQWVHPQEHDYVVLDGGSLAGIVSVSSLLQFPRSEWAETPLSMALNLNTPSIPDDELAERALVQFVENALSILPVHDSESREFVGSISSHEALEAVELSAQRQQFRR